tara:strand:- start:1076 stop:1972 length:897 start_codon:yes stop_codon:yes gene_type:complete
MRDRRTYLGGSDIAGVLNTCPYSSPLQVWHRKVNGEEKTDSDGMYFGRRLEGFVKREFKKRNKEFKIIKGDVIKHDIYEYLSGSPDGYLLASNGDRFILEIKTCNEYNKEKWEKGVPENYYAQVQWYMGLSGLKSAYVACFAGGNKYYQYEIPFSIAFFEDAVAKAVKFWERYVLVGEQPRATDKDCDRRLLGLSITQSEKEDILRTSYLDEPVSEYQQLKEQEKALKKQLRLNYNRILEEMGTHPKAESHSFKLDYKTHNRTTVDSKKLAKEYPEVFSKVMKQAGFDKLSIKSKVKK